MTIKLKASSGNQLLPEGTYEASLAKVEQASNANGAYLKWTFTLDCPGQTQTILGFTPMSLEPDSRARYWTEALLCRSLMDGEEVDLEQLYGRVCRIELTVITKEGRQFNQIGRVLRKGLVLQSGQQPSPASPSNVEESDNPF